MRHGRSILAVAGAVLSVLLALAAANYSSTQFAARLATQARGAIAKAGGRGIVADFTTEQGWPTRHPILRGGQKLNDSVRLAVARAVAAIPGVGAIRWADGSTFAKAGEEPIKPLHCEEDVDALLRARTIRFEESSAEIDPASLGLVSEVAEALRPCLGSIIAVVGHTDSSGNAAGNLLLSRERAEAVQQALVERGIPADGLRTSGLGSAEPISGLDPSDPANRRIEFSVIATMPIEPTPVDIPGPH
jgi:OOP family OmpA-OmpF porin